MVCFQVDQELGWSLVPNAIAAVGLVMSLIVLIFGIRFRIDGKNLTQFSREGLSF